MLRTSSALVAALIVMALALAGCGGGTTDTAGTTSSPAPKSSPAPTASPDADASPSPRPTATAGAEGASAGEPQSDVTITMTEFSFEPAEFTIPAGEEVTLTLTNDGEVRHEFMAGREVMTDDGSPHGYTEDFFAGVEPTVSPESAREMGEEHGDHGGFMVMVQPGETVEVTFTAPEGKSGQWDIGCFEPGHYEAGMTGTMTVR